VAKGFIGKNLSLEKHQGRQFDLGSTPPRKCKRVVRSCGGGIALLVGKDIKVNQTPYLEGRSLVGKFCD
jgi:hypothetical protein